MVNESPTVTADNSASTELTGGSGFTFEDSVVGWFLAALLLRHTAAGTPGEVVRVAVQQRAAGQPLDDVVVDTTDAQGKRRISLQVKKSLTISAAARNRHFRQIIADCRATRADPDFRVGYDAYGVAVQSVAVGRGRAFRRILELAGASTSAGEFVQRFEGPGATSIEQRKVRNDLRPLIADTDEGEWDFYLHFIMLDFAGLEPGGPLKSTIGSSLDSAIATGSAGSGAALFSTLCRAARVGAGGGKVWTRPVLLLDVSSQFRLRGIPAFADDLETISRLTSTAVAEISDEAGGHHVDRSTAVERAFELLKTYRLVNITGLPGCGKSAILRNCAERLTNGPVLFLKSDLLNCSDWQEYAVAKGLDNRDPVELLTEIGATGSAILFVDGIDRIPPPNRAIVKDLMRAIIDEPALQQWRVLVSSRNQGMEPFRVWVPADLHKGSGIGELAVDVFNDVEAECLAAQAPSLRPLLFGSTDVRSIARRPFFAAVLAGGGGERAEDTHAQSESHLIRYWWEGGGYDARGEALPMRRHALLDLARVGGRSLGKSVNTMLLKLETQQRLPELADDGIIRISVEDDAVSFAHDIFFEWAYFRLLIGLRREWTSALIETGQPPLLGRVVGLLAQHAIDSGRPWQQELAQLDDPGLRPQWRRAWVTGPAASPKLGIDSAQFTSAMEANDWTLMRSFLVWFQAEQTVPNPLVLGNAELSLDGGARVRMADMAGWPGDQLTWVRVIFWLISIRDRLPVRLLPLVFELFKVWQFQFSATENPVSAAILAVCAEWLEDIESVSYREDFSHDRGRWTGLRGEALKTFENELRQTILLAMQAYPDPGNALLDRAIVNDRLRPEAYETIVGLAPTIASVSPQKLADLARAELLKQLPKDEFAGEEERQRRTLEFLARVRAKPESERTEAEVLALEDVPLRSLDRRSEHDLRKLATNDLHRSYFPASPLEEPFASLFRSTPDIARALVRDLGNHATTAWRQIHELEPRRYGTPIPMDLEFPWGSQRFWGDLGSYNWASEYPAPNPITCAFMALAYWAHKQLEDGVSVDGLVQQVVEGHESLAVLALGIALALESGHASATVLPIAAAQRLWKMDMDRVFQEPMRGADLLGLGGLNRRPPDKEAALNYLRSRASCERDIRALVPLFALSREPDLRAAFRECLARFPVELPYNYEEERNNPSLEAELREQAEQWAGFGDGANYRASPVHDSPKVLIEYVSPVPVSDEKQQRAEEAGAALDEHSIAGWAAKSLRLGALEPSRTLESAFAVAQTRDTPTLFERLTPAGGGMAQVAVAGVAACILVFGKPSPEVEAWARDVMRRVEGMQEERDEVRGGNLPWHPAFLLITTLRADLGNPEMKHDAAARLIGLCGHPDAKVTEAALAALLSCSELPIAWNAVVLASDLWHYHEPVIRSGGERDFSAQRAAVAAAVARAAARLRDEAMAVPGPLPEPWPRRQQRWGIGIGEADFFGTREPNVIFDYSAAAETVQKVPIEALCGSDQYKAPFLAYVRNLAAWTVGRFNPEDQPPDRGRLRRREYAGLSQWPARLGELLARIVPFVEAETMKADYLGAFLEPDDENGLELTSHFAESVVCRHVLDAPSIHPHALPLLSLCLDQVRADPALRRSNYRSGKLHGFHLPRAVKSLLFVPISEEASGSARFANGDWTDLPLVLPLVEDLVRECGWAPDVMEVFLTLAERAGISYPIDAFVTLVTSVLTELGGNADGWVGSMMPARLSGAIQVLADGNYPLSQDRATALLRLLDMLIDHGDRRAAALEQSETFREIRTGP